MHDPMTIAHEIRSPIPEVRTRTPGPGKPQGPRWNAHWYVGDKEWYFPPLVTIWHVEPDDQDSGTVCARDTNWRWHVRHWEIHLEPVKKWRRRIMTRCAECGGRSTKATPVNCSLRWDSRKVPWWYPEPELYHQKCSALLSRRAKQNHDAQERQKAWDQGLIEANILTQTAADLKYLGEDEAAGYLTMRAGDIKNAVDRSKADARAERATHGTAST